MSTSRFASFAALAITLALAGCGGGGEKKDEKGGGGSGAGVVATPTEKTVALPSGKSVKIAPKDSGGGGFDMARLFDAATEAFPDVEAEAELPYPGPAEITLLVVADKKESGGEDAVWDEGSKTIKAFKGCPSWFLVKEVAHLYYGPKVATDRWAQQGLAHHVALRVLRKKPHLGDEAWVRGRILAAVERASDDPPLKDAPPPADEAKKQTYDGKACLFFHVVANRAGDDAIKKAVAAVAAKGAPADGQAFADALVAANEAAKEILPGWVTPGSYGLGLSSKVCHDEDEDGLSDIEEEHLGTDPKKADSDDDGVSDGDEVLFYKTDPHKRDKEIRKPIAEGTADDPAGDHKAPGDDIVRVTASVDAAFLTLETGGGFKGEGFYGFEIDTDGDGSADVIVGFTPGKDPAVGFTRKSKNMSETEMRPCPASRLTIEGTKATLRVPRAELGPHKSLAIVAFTLSSKDAKERADEASPIKLALP